jgi:DNA-binding transcriptional LysR family regulator
MAPIASRLKLSQLRALVAIADRGNFSQAALDLEISQSAVSHAIATLEDELGAILLRRGRHGATLTETGRVIADSARQVLHLLNGIEHQARRARGLETGHVRVACFRSVATHLLPKAIEHLRQRHPGIAIAIDEYDTSQDIEEELRTGRADIGFVLLPAGEEFETWTVLHDEYWAFVPSSDRYDTEAIAWDDLFSRPLILPPKRFLCAQIVLDRFAQLGLAIEPSYEVREDSTILSMVAQGLGVTVMARLAAEPIPPQVRSYRLPVPFHRHIGLAIAAKDLHLPPVFAVLDTLKSTIAQLTLPGQVRPRSVEQAMIPTARPPRIKKSVC